LELAADLSRRAIRIMKGKTLEFELRKPFDALVSAANRRNGWVNWSGLATLLAGAGKDLADALRRAER
jgi:hypothetical protein